MKIVNYPEMLVLNLIVCPYICLNMSIVIMYYYIKHVFNLNV